VLALRCIDREDQQCYGSHVRERDKYDPRWDSNHTPSAIRTVVLSVGVSVPVPERFFRMEIYIAYSIPKKANPDCIPRSQERGMHLAFHVSRSRTGPRHFYHVLSCKK